MPPTGQRGDEVYEATANKSMLRQIERHLTPFDETDRVKPEETRSKLEGKAKNIHHHGCDSKKEKLQNEKKTDEKRGKKDQDLCCGKCKGTRNRLLGPGRKNCEEAEKKESRRGGRVGLPKKTLKGSSGGGEKKKKSGKFRR